MAIKILSDQSNSHHLQFALTEALCFLSHNGLLPTIMGARPAYRYQKACLPPINSLICPDPPDSVSVAEFMSSEEYGRYPITKARHPYTCGLTGKTRTAEEVIRREDYLTRGIGKALQLDSQPGSEWDRVCVIFSLNTVSRVFHK